MRIEHMKPGHELDALVAEKVMGWRKEGPLLVPPEYTRKDVMSGKPVGLPPYSDDIAAAWRAAEKFTDVFRLEKAFRNGRVYWWCELYDGQEGHSAESATADTAPLAICLAAIKAVSGG